MCNSKLYRRFFLCLCVPLLLFYKTSTAQRYDTAGTKQTEIIKADIETNAEKFDEINARDKNVVQPRKVNEAELKRIKAEDDFWYVNEAPKRTKRKEVTPPLTSGDFFAKTWFRNLMWFLIIGGFVVILVWFLISSDVQIFQKKKTKIVTNEDELPTENIFEIDYEAEIEKAIGAKNFRLAIRLLYLQLLKEMDEKGIINYKQERTNADYVLQLFGTVYYKEFFSLTRSFEYTWYGRFGVSDEAFRSIQNSFSTFKQRLLQ